MRYVPMLKKERGFKGIRVFHRVVKALSKVFYHEGPERIEGWGMSEEVFAWKQKEKLFEHIGQSDRILLNEFDGPNEIHGMETFDFLDRWLNDKK